MKRGVFLSVAIALLASCDSSSGPEGFYVIDDISITYDSDTDNQSSESDPDQSVKNTIRDTMVGLKDTTFFRFEPGTVTVDNSGSEFDSTINGNTFYLNNIKTTWTTPDSGKTLYLTTDKEGACGFFNCTMKMTLTSADHTSVKLAGLKAVSDARGQAYQAYLDTQRLFYRETGFTDLPGDNVRLSENIVLRLPEMMALSMSKQTEGSYLRDIAGTSVDRDSENVDVYRFRDPETGAEGIAHLVRGPESTFKIDEWLKKQKGVVYQEPDGVIYYNRWGRIEGLTWRYDAPAKTWVLVVSETTDPRVMVRMFSVLRSLSDTSGG